MPRPSSSGPTPPVLRTRPAEPRALAAPRRHRTASRVRSPVPSRPSPGRWRAVAGGLVVLTTVVVVAGTSSAGADPAETSPCPEIASRYVDQLPAGWTLECRSALPDGWPHDGPASAMSSRAERRIVVVDGQGRDHTEASIAHEIAHAESTTWPAELKVGFAQAVGARAWTGPGGPDSPAEVFAESSVRCRGLPTHVSYPLVPCDLVEAARAAGGATSPLPVTGDRPRR